MFLNQISLFNFRNHIQVDFDFAERIICITGQNGTGKTNVLDAIHLLSLSRSYFTSADYRNINFNEQFLVVNAKLSFDEKNHLIQCRIARNEKKLIKVDHISYTRISDHLGFMPVVMISPFDIALLYDGKSDRRKFLDSILSQCDREYLHGLQDYQRCIDQRNSLLKQFSYDKQDAFAQLDAWNAKIAPLAQSIYVARKQLFSELNSLFDQYYKAISGGNESVSIAYISQLHNENIEKLLRSNTPLEIGAGRSLYGTHRDDIEIDINGEPARNYASQGQAKTIVIALKLAQAAYLKKHLLKNPLMLLDDIFEKLDEKRAFSLMEVIGNDLHSQVFITDTHEQRVKNIFDHLKKKVSYFALS